MPRVFPSLLFCFSRSRASLAARLIVDLFTGGTATAPGVARVFMMGERSATLGWLCGKKRLASVQRLSE